MPIVYNSPAHVKERASVEALSMADMQSIADSINYYLDERMMQQDTFELFQRLIWRYENLEHFEAATKHMLDEYIERHNLKFEIEQLKRIQILDADAVIYPKWISIDEALPERNQLVLTYTPQTEITDEQQRLITYGNIGGGFPSGITRWMPLPPNPTQDVKSD